ncbi:MAG: BrnA antitoxin family protein [Desulfurivibrionaceae bacterium]
MGARLKSTKQNWVDPDDAPELTGEEMDRGVWRIGDKVVSPEKGKAAFAEALRRGRPPVDTPRKAINIRLSQDILDTFKATGKGWQTRVNEALREWLKTHTPA